MSIFCIPNRFKFDYFYGQQNKNNISPSKFDVISNSFYASTSGSEKEMLRLKEWTGEAALWKFWNLCCFLFLQRWRTTSRPAVPRARQKAPNCVSCAGETVPSPTRSLTMTTPEPFSQYHTFFDPSHFLHAFTSSHVSHKYNHSSVCDILISFDAFFKLFPLWEHTLLLVTKVCNVDAPVDRSTF